jgi:hypothetical protein
MHTWACRGQKYTCEHRSQRRRKKREANICVPALLLMGTVQVSSISSDPTGGVVRGSETPRATTQCGGQRDKGTESSSVLGTFTDVS